MKRGQAVRKFEDGVNPGHVKRALKSPCVLIG